MTITVSATSEIVKLNGVPGRLWEGKSESRKEVVAFITRIATPDENIAAQDEFQKELLEVKPPTTVDKLSNNWKIVYPISEPQASQKFDESIETLGRLYEAGKDFMADNMVFAGVAGYNTMVGILHEMREIAATALRENRYNDTGASTKDTSEER